MLIYLMITPENMKKNSERNGREHLDFNKAIYKYICASYLVSSMIFYQTYRYDFDFRSVKIYKF